MKTLKGKIIGYPKKCLIGYPKEKITKFEVKLYQEETKKKMRMLGYSKNIISGNNVEVNYKTDKNKIDWVDSFYILDEKMKRVYRE